MAVLSLILAVTPMAALVKLNRGAPLRNGRNESRLEDWQMISLGNREGGALICDKQHPCHASALTARQKDGVACVWVGRFLLNASLQPFVMRDIRIRAYVTVRYPVADYVTTGVTGFYVPWDRGWWWRAEPQRISVHVPMPCGGFPMQISLQVYGKDLFGRSRGDGQGLDFNSSDTLP